VERKQADRLLALRARRDPAKWQAALKAVEDTARGTEPALILDQNTLSSRDAAPHDKLVATVSETLVTLLAA
jgi:methylmalonyl-CoA mutase N-terminal domain/subunit